MASRTWLTWIALAGAACFLAGVLVQRFVAGAAGLEEPPTYAERLTPTLGLTDEQHQELLRILAEEDRRILTLLDGEESQALRRAIQEIREETERRILDLLDPEQRERFESMLRTENPSGGEGG